jgi:hypothetical protein
MCVEYNTVISSPILHNAKSNRLAFALTASLILLATWLGVF